LPERNAKAQAADSCIALKTPQQKPSLQWLGRSFAPNIDELRVSVEFTSCEMLLLKCKSQIP
jgi:hypothetical protein